MARWSVVSEFSIFIWLQLPQLSALLSPGSKLIWPHKTGGSKQTTLDLNTPSKMFALLDIATRIFNFLCKFPPVTQICHFLGLFPFSTTCCSFDRKHFLYNPNQSFQARCCYRLERRVGRLRRSSRAPRTL